MEEESWRVNHGGEILEEEYVGEIVEERSSRRNHGGEIMEEGSWRRNEASGKNLGGAWHPGDTQGTPKRLPETPEADGRREANLK